MLKLCNKSRRGSSSSWESHLKVASRRTSCSCTPTSMVWMISAKPRTFKQWSTTRFGLKNYVVKRSSASSQERETNGSVQVTLPSWTTKKTRHFSPLRNMRLKMMRSLLSRNSRKSPSMQWLISRISSSWKDLTVDPRRGHWTNPCSSKIGSGTQRVST